MRELKAVVSAYRAATGQGEPLLLGTVVKVVGSTHRQPGARMLMTKKRHLEGVVGGGCLERHLLARSVWHTERSRFVRLSFDSTSDADGQGVVDVLVERLQPGGALNPLTFIDGCLARRQGGVLATVVGAVGQGAALGQRLTLTASGQRASDLGPPLADAVAVDAGAVLAGAASQLALYPLPDGCAEVFLEWIPAPTRLLVFGGGYDVVPLVQLASVLGWQVTVVADRPGPALRAVLGLAEVVVTSPERLAGRVNLAADALAVLMTHNYAHDLALLRTLLAAPPRYLGLLGPRRRTERLLAELAREGRPPSEEALARLHGPAGLDLGAEQPEQIALAILAEAQAALAGSELDLARAPGR